MRPRSLHALAVLATTLLLVGRAGAQVQGGAPVAGRPDDLPPVTLFAQRTLHQPPPLDGRGGEATRKAIAFIAWAGASVPEEREDARRTIAAAAQNGDVARAICRETTKWRKKDGTRSLLALSILGEMRNVERGMPCLLKFMKLTPSKRGVPDRESGELPDESSLAMLQAKAVDGIAYLRSPDADAEVLRIAREHPHRAVRAEAIAAYLWNHGASQEARAVLRDAVLPDEAIFIDRVQKEDGEGADTFDPKLAAFRRAHPELEPPVEEPGGAHPPKDEPQEPQLEPSFEGLAFGSTCGRTEPACNGSCPQGSSCKPDPSAGCRCTP